MKTTQKEIKRLVKIGAAVDITTAGNIKELCEEEGGFNRIACSIGVYGLNGLVLRGNKSNKLYAITARSTVLFMV